MQWITDPARIELESYKVIDTLLKNIDLPDRELSVVRRVLHATADPELAKGLVFHPQAIDAGLKAIGAKKNIITDVNMVRVGISGYKGKIICLVDKEYVGLHASKSNITRCAQAMREGSSLMNEGVVVIGNAPTALFEVCRMVEDKKIEPALIIGVPVGFIGAADVKRRLSSLPIPYITNHGRRGGSSVAVAIVNALLTL